MSVRLSTWTEMLSRVKRTAKDNGTDRIWGDDHIKSVVFDAVLDLVRDCPDAVLKASGTLRPLPISVNAVLWDSSELPTSPFYDGAIEALAMHKLMVGDANDLKDESLARYWLSRYMQLTKGA